MGNKESRINKWMGDGTDQDYRAKVPIITSQEEFRDLIKMDIDPDNIEDYSIIEKYPNILKLLISYDEHRPRRLNLDIYPKKYLFMRLKDSIWWALNHEGKLDDFCKQQCLSHDKYKKATDFWNEWENTHDFTINHIDQNPWETIPSCLKMIKRYKAIVHNNYIQLDNELKKNFVKYIDGRVKSNGGIGECPICQEYYVCCGFSSCPHTLCAACTRNIVKRNKHKRENGIPCPLCRNEIRAIFFFIL